MRPLNSRFRLLSLRLSSPVALLLVLLWAASCKHSGPVSSGEIMYVSAPQANLRDHVAAVYNRVGAVKNGDRIQVLERQKRFVRVRTAQKVEGWIELRALVPSETFEQFQQLSKENRATPLEGHGVTRVELNMHVSPGRETDTLYQLAENSKVEMLKRATTGRATPEEIAAVRAAELAKAVGEQAKATQKKTSAVVPKNAQKNGSTAAPNATPAQAPPPTAQLKAAPQELSRAAPAAASESTTRYAAGPVVQSGTRSGSQPTAQSVAQSVAQPVAPSAVPIPDEVTKPMDDWWLVRDQQGHVGWVLARMVDLDIPLEVAQYAEGQRIQAAFVLNTVPDEVKGATPQYLVLLNENKDGIPYDFNQVRVFTWNLKRHRYETGYREHFIIGYFPAKVSTKDFGKEGVMPVFSIRKQNADGSIAEREYRVIGNIVRPVLAPGEQTKPAAHAPGGPKKSEAKSAGRRSAHAKSNARKKRKS